VDFATVYRQSTEGSIIIIIIIIIIDIFKVA